MDFAINYISAPKLPLGDFVAMVRRLGLDKIEIRNDIPDVVGTVPAADVRAAAAAGGVEILSINALYPFNLWTDDLAKRAEAMADFAAECGAKALVMCPLNDGRRIPHEEAAAALRAMAPILAERRLTGLVEPLGFPISSLRTKRDALAAIDAADSAETYRLLHDTFHHHLAGETEFFPDRTALVHISGVTDPSVSIADMLDDHRVLVDADDRLENLSQIRSLVAAGYRGRFAFEPFARRVHDLADPESALRDSIRYVRANAS